MTVFMLSIISIFPSLRVGGGHLGLLVKKLFYVPAVPVALGTIKVIVT